MRSDLHEHGVALLAPYRCVCSVGHDEYWSREMRLAADEYVADGGHIARFAGNFMCVLVLAPHPFREQRSGLRPNPAAL